MEKQQKLDAPAPNSCIYNARVHIGKLKWGKMNFLDHGKIAKLLLVTRHHPSALGHQLGGLLVNGLLGGGNLINGKLVEWPGLLDVLKGSGQVLQLQVDGLLGGLCVLDGLNLKGVNGLDLAGDIVGDGLEGLESLLDLVNDGLVLQDGAVVGEVDGGRLLGQLLDLAAGVLVALLEGLQGGDGLAAEAQGRGDLDPVELESCASKLTYRLLYRESN